MDSEIMLLFMSEFEFAFLVKHSKEMSFNSGQVQMKVPSTLSLASFVSFKYLTGISFKNLFYLSIAKL